MAKFKKGTKVAIHYPYGHMRWGEIVAQVNKRSLPNTKKHRFNKAPTGMGRGHVSYVVQDCDGKCYWPLVKYIQAA